MGIQVRCMPKYKHIIRKVCCLYCRRPAVRGCDRPDLLQGLTKLLSDNAPAAMSEHTFDNYFGRKLAVDASMHIYAFLVSRPAGCPSGAPSGRDADCLICQSC